LRASSTRSFAFAWASVVALLKGNYSASVVIASGFCEAIPNLRIGDCVVGKNRLLAMTA